MERTMNVTEQKNGIISMADPAVTNLLEDLRLTTKDILSYSRKEIRTTDETTKRMNRQAMLALLNAIQNQAKTLTEQIKNMNK